MKHISCSMSTEVYNNLQELLNEAYFRAADSILTCCLTRDQIDHIQIALH